MKKRIAYLMVIIALVCTLTNLTSNTGVKGHQVAKEMSKIILADASDPLIDPGPHIIAPTSPTSM